MCKGECYHVWREAFTGRALFLVMRCFPSRSAANKYARRRAADERVAHQVRKCPEACYCRGRHGNH